MRARLTYFPSLESKARSVVVEVTPDELATLRAALALPPETLAHAVAKVRTYAPGGSVRHVPYPLRAVHKIKPFRPRPAAGRQDRDEKECENAQEQGCPVHTLGRDEKPR